MVSAQNISFKIKEAQLLKPTSVEFEAGKFHVIMGANGAGKSTLLKLLAGDVKPTTGDIFYGKSKLTSYSVKALAKIRAVLSQHYHLAFPISVEEIVLMGRYPYFATQPTQSDLAICKNAMAVMDVEAFINRDYNTLSGGEAQKVQMSRVLAQIGREGISEKVLFLDEPVSHLDIKYQFQLLEAAKELCAAGVTVIAVLHDINLTISFADHILFMKGGTVLHQIGAAEHLTPAILQEVFDVKATILKPEAHKPVVIF